MSVQSHLSTLNWTRNVYFTCSSSTFFYLFCVVCSVLYPICTVWWLIIVPYPRKRPSSPITFLHAVLKAIPPRRIEVQIVFRSVPQQTYFWLCWHDKMMCQSKINCLSFQQLAIQLRMFTFIHNEFSPKEKLHSLKLCVLELSSMTIGKIQISLISYNGIDNCVRYEGTSTIVYQHL